MGAHAGDGRPGRHEVELADGTRFTTDLLIGADGAWSRVRPLVTDAWPAYTGISWPRVPGVTLLGDAAHLMSPFAGEGANLAMDDGARLGLALAGHPDDPEAALAAYEIELFRRAAASAGESAASMDVLFAPDSPSSLIRMFEELSEKGPADG